jgi:hypothetical protein
LCLAVEVDADGSNLPEKREVSTCRILLRAGY